MVGLAHAESVVQASSGIDHPGLADARSRRSANLRCAAAASKIAELVNAPVLVVSGADNAGEMAKKFGAAGLFETPLDPDRILAAVQTRVHVSSRAVGGGASRHSRIALMKPTPSRRDRRKKSAGPNPRAEPAPSRRSAPGVATSADRSANESARFATSP